MILGTVTECIYQNVILFKIAFNILKQLGVFRPLIKLTKGYLRNDSVSQVHQPFVFINRVEILSCQA